MAFYEHTFVGRQDLSDKEIDNLVSKYSDIIKKSGKILKIEKWGLLNLATKIKRNRKGIFIHFKFEGKNEIVKDIEKKLEQSLEQSKKLEKQLKSLQQSRAADTAKDLVGQAETIGDVACITANLGESDGNYAQAVADALMRQFEGVVVLGATGNGSVVLVASVSDSLTNKVQAGKLIQTIAPIVGGKGGGKPAQARPSPMFCGGPTGAPCRTGRREKLLRDR